MSCQGSKRKEGGLQKEEMEAIIAKVHAMRAEAKMLQAAGVKSNKEEGCGHEVMPARVSHISAR